MKVLLLIVVFICLQLDLRAQLQGCVVATNTTNIYTNHTSTTQQINGLCPIICTYVAIYNTPLSSVSPSCPRAVVGSTTGVQCYANSTVGFIHNYQRLDPPLQCSLDSDVFLTTVFLFLAALLSRKKQRTCMMM